MFNQLYPFYTANLYYVPQFTAPEMQYSTFYPQLPVTYQPEFFLPSQQFIQYPSEWQVPETRPIPTEAENKHSDSEETLEKSDQKRTYKKFSIFKYPKKNAESNIINQIFSFLSLRAKSEPLLEKILENNQ